VFAPLNRTFYGNGYYLFKTEAIDSDEQDLSASTAFRPPKAKKLDNAASMGISRVVFGT
jgi:hypothetical protein